MLKIAIVSDFLPTNECSMHSLIPYVIAHMIFSNDIDIVLVGESQGIGLRTMYVDIHVTSSPNSISRVWNLAMQVSILLGELVHEGVDIFHAFGITSGLATTYVAQSHCISFAYTSTNTYSLKDSLEVLSAKAIEEEIMNFASTIIIFDEITKTLSMVPKKYIKLSLQDPSMIKKLKDIYRGLT